jgi:parvulin-like peptidyl-prolyl isomerase
VVLGFFIDGGSKNLKKCIPCSIGVAILLFSVSVLSGCGGKKVAVRVNSDSITEEEFLNRTQDVDAVSLYNSVQHRGPATAGEYAMVSLIREKLVLQLAAEKKALPTEDQINRFLHFAKKYTQQNPFTSEETKRREARIELAMRNLAMQPVKLTEAEIRKQYEDWVRQALTEPDRYRLRIMKTKEKADKVLESLKKGVPFETLALTESDDPASRQQSGDIGFRAQAELPPVLFNAIKDLKPGAYTTKPVVVTSNQPGTAPQTGYLLAQLIEKRPGREPTFEEVRPLCEDRALQAKEPMAAQRVANLLREFQQKANIQINLPRYQDIVGKIKSPSRQPLPAGTPSGAPRGGTSLPGSPSKNEPDTKPSQR